MAAAFIPLIHTAINGVFGLMSSRSKHSAALQREREESERKIRAIEDQLKREREEADNKRQKFEKEMKEELGASEEKRKAREEEFREQMQRAEEKQREIEERLMREKEEAERKKQELEEQLRQEAERAKAAEEARAMFEANWRAGVHPGIASLTPEQIKQAKSSYLDGRTHIAFVGQSGTGKSTLVNSIRGMKASAAGAALVNQNEGTRKIDRYTDPIHPQHVWYDVPGAGTLECPDWQYFMDKELYVYDALVVVFSDRIMQNDLRVLGNADELEIPTFLVRSKSDQIMRNMETDYEEDAKASKARYIRTTYDYVREVLGQAECDSNKKVYMISREGVLQIVKGGTPKIRLNEQELLDDLLRVQGGK